MNDPYRTNAQERPRVFFNWDNWRLRYMRIFTKRRVIPEGLRPGFEFVWHTVLGGIILFFLTMVAFKVGAYLNEAVFGNIPMERRDPRYRDNADGYYVGCQLLGLAAVTSVLWLRFLYRAARELLT